MRSPSAELFTTRSKLLFSRPMSPPTTSYRASELSPNSYRRPLHNSTSDDLLKGSAGGRRSARSLYRERLSNSSILNRSAANRSNQHQIQDVGSKLKDMNNKILQAMAESRRTVVRLLTETVSDGAASFDQKLDFASDDWPGGSALLDSKPGLVNLKTVDCYSPALAQQPQPALPTNSRSTSRVAESVNEIQPRSAFVMESLASGISEGQRTSNFTGLIQ